MHSFKMLIHPLMTPLALASVLAVAAVLLRAVRLRSAAWVALFGAVAVVYLGSTSLVGDWLLGPLERRFPPLDPATLGPNTAAYIVVLGSGYAPTDHVPASAALNDDGLARVVEAVTIGRRLPAARLVVSGGTEPGGTPCALGYAKLAGQLGIEVPREHMLLTPEDTEEESRAIKALIGHERFILVTSAYHMPRAMRLMRRAGLDPIAAPTGQRVGVPVIGVLKSFMPTSWGMRKTELALHEYAGLIAMGAGIT